MYIEEMEALHETQEMERSKWMGLLARASLDRLEEVLESYTHLKHDILKPFETVAYMVQARTGSTGQRFNVGEVSVGRMVIKLHLPTHEDPQRSYVGVAYVKGASEHQTYLTALADALLQESSHHKILLKALLEPISTNLEREQETMNQKVQATRVEFFTVARENNASSV